MKNTASKSIIDILILCSVMAIIIATGMFVSRKDPILLQVVIWIAYLVALIIIYYLQRRRKEGWSALGFKGGGSSFWRRTILFAVITFVLATLGFVLSAIVLQPLGLIPDTPMDTSSYDFLKGNIWILITTLLAVYFGSSLGEEVVFRGFLIHRLRSIFNAKYANLLALLISGVLFGLVHYGWGTVGVIQTTVMGWVLGYCFIRFGKNLWIVIIAHAIMDTLLIAQMY